LLKGKVHFIYRAIGSDYISRFGYASSKNGEEIDKRLEKPAYQHRTNYGLYRSSWSGERFVSSNISSGGSFGGAEDPRLTRVDNEDKIYMTYTAWDRGLRMALTSIKVEDFLKNRWNWSLPRLISPPGEVHKNWLIFPEKIRGKYAILHSISPKISIIYLDSMNFNGYIKSYYDGGNAKSKDLWEERIRGAGPPPIKTKEGWLLFYHAIDKKDPGKYKVGAMILDTNNPTKILYRSKRPVLEPDQDYENSGFKPGVVYATGAVVKGDNLYLYYGAADNYVCVARANLKEFLDSLKEQDGD